MNPKVSIVIPHWNGEALLKDCLRSLNEIIYNNYQIVIVDNASEDNSVKMIGAKFPKVKVLENKKNLGFAVACNQGINFALKDGADFVLLLNNDTVVAPNFLNKMVDAVEDEKVGIVGAKIYYFDEPKKIWFAGGKYVKRRSSAQHKNWMKNDDKSLSGVLEVDFITGCTMLIKKEVFEDIGFFYEPYFLTFEDVDFCHFARMAGWRVVVNLDSKIWHKVSASRKGEMSFSNGYYGTRNRLFFAFKRGRYYLGGLNLLFVLLPIRIVLWIFHGEKKMVRGTLLGIIDFLKNKMGARK